MILICFEIVKLANMVYGNLVSLSNKLQLKLMSRDIMYSGHKDFGFKFFSENNTSGRRRIKVSRCIKTKNRPTRTKLLEMEMGNEFEAKKTGK